MVKVNFREPKYKRLIRTKPRSTITKSQNLDLHLYLIAYDNPDDIPFNAIAEVTGTEPNKIRALMRSVNDVKIYLGLLEIGISSEDIPHWYARPKFIKKIVKKAQANVVGEEKRQIPERINVISHPLEGLNLPQTFKPYRSPEPETSIYYDYSDERYMSPAVEKMWRTYNEGLRADNQRRENEREEERKRRERMNRPPTPEEASALGEMIMLDNALKAKREWETSIYIHNNIQQKRARREEDVREAIALSKETAHYVNNAIIEMNKPKKVPVNIAPYVPQNKDNRHKALNDFSKSLDDERPAGLQELAKLGKEVQEKYRAAKLARYGHLLRPMENIFPPGFKQIKLLSGPRGEEIYKRINLDHLRK